MALPLLKSAVACTDFTRTVEPYISQLYDLPQKFLQSATNAQALKELYLNTNPLLSAFAVSLTLVPIIALVVSEVNKNYSQIDRVWSLLPTVYNLHYVAYAHAKGLPTQRLDSLAIISTVWSARLTYNYWRKGGYTVGSEDYRWNIVKDYVSNPVIFFIFNVVFISWAQSFLLFSVTLPTYVLLLAAPIIKPQTADIAFSQILLGCIFLAYASDQQQWDFYAAKNSYQKTAKAPPSGRFTAADLDRGFNTKGLWSLSRHPNFLAEQSVWVTLYIWSCWMTGTSYHWAGLGAASYLILFQSSTWLTELITAGKYPDYKMYQKRVGKFVPSLWGEGMPDANVEGKKQK
ncbi:MAG: hypothetical protein L6R40_006229 [Gallowayella cf. fulva]|nr:MAG: hypothetical protein L6R40_006229 [Xanthomendoza cf. fulva]